MTAIANSPIRWPFDPYIFSTATVNGLVDAATEKFAMIGRLYINGGSGTKTLSTGTIQFRTQSVTWANGTSKLDIGIQGVASGSGPIAQPDGVFTVKTTLTGGSGLSANAWNTATMNSGSASLTHGDKIAVVWDLTAVAGGDLVNITAGSAAGGTIPFPNTNAFVSSAWQTTQTIGALRAPNAIILFDDGTLGWIDGAAPFSTATTTTFQDSSNPDELGTQFQVPFACNCDQLWAIAGITDANSDFTFKLYQDPTSSPTQLASIAMLAENMGNTGSQALTSDVLATPVVLSPGVNYGVTVRATGTSNTRLAGVTIQSALHRDAYGSGSTFNLTSINRQNDAGNFGSSSTTLYGVGVRISEIVPVTTTTPVTFAGL